jgi:hypothetical protein
MKPIVFGALFWNAMARSLGTGRYERERLLKTVEAVPAKNARSD